MNIQIGRSDSKEREFGYFGSCSPIEESISMSIEEAWAADTLQRVMSTSSKLVFTVFESLRERKVSFLLGVAHTLSLWKQGISTRENSDNVQMDCH